MTARWLLPAAAVEAAATQVGVGLPTGLRTGLDEARLPQAQAALVEGGAATADGLDPALAHALGTLAEPAVTVRLTARTVEGRPRTAAAWQAWYVLAGDALLGLLRRDDSDLVEVVAAAPTDLRSELDRVVAAMPPTGARVAALPPAVVPLVELARPVGLDAARVVEQAQQALEAVVSGRPRHGSTPVGSLLWYRLADGWLAVEPAPDEPGDRPVRIRPAQPAELPATLAPLVAGALG